MLSSTYNPSKPKKEVGQSEEIQVTFIYIEILREAWFTDPVSKKKRKKESICNFCNNTLILLHKKANKIAMKKVRAKIESWAKNTNS